MVLSVFYTYLSYSQELPVEKPNCKLSIHTKFKDGRKKLHILETHTYSRVDCRHEARLRKLSSQSDDEVDDVKVFFAFRGPAIIYVD